eukprot:NODE_368_length_8682_cov_0.309915.p4 type:complete len:287 gc:universal NODE_368_length_8682_cov_0.309915:7166-8026(+)
MTHILLLLIPIFSTQSYWSDNFQYPIRTESNSNKINLVMLADDFYKVPCGRRTAGWIRALWHDFGTFDQSDNSGGLDGSILYELDRLENTRLDTPTYYIANKANDYNVPLSDAIYLAGIIAIRRCGGPKIPFYYGREDASEANPSGRMLFTNATFADMKQFMVVKNGFSFPQFVASIGVGHTVGKLNKDFGPMKAGGLDTTIDSPNAFDNLYFQNLLINNTDITTFASDLQLLTDPYSLRMVRRLGRNQPYFFKLARSVMTWMGTAGWYILIDLGMICIIWMYGSG